MRWWYGSPRPEFFTTGYTGGVGGKRRSVIHGTLGGVDPRTLTFREGGWDCHRPLLCPQRSPWPIPLQGGETIRTHHIIRFELAVEISDRGAVW